ncbi:hypothetical protein Aperf_G00000008370 [Anoplocephala perfoliata]
MLLLENPKPGSPMYPYTSPPVPPNTTSINYPTPDIDSSTNAMLLPGQLPQTPNSMLYSSPPPPSYTSGPPSQSKPGYLATPGTNNANPTATSNNNGSGPNPTNNGAMSDIMSHSMMQSSISPTQPQQQANNNAGSFYCWPPPPNAPTSTNSRLPHMAQRRTVGGTGYRISPQNPSPAEFSHAQYYFRQQQQQQPHQANQHKAVSETGAYGVVSNLSSSSNPSSAGGSSSSSNWKERPHVGKYSLIRTIGKGNFAKVKLAQHVTTGMEV